VSDELPRPGPGPLPPLKGQRAAPLPHPTTGQAPIRVDAPDPAAGRRNGSRGRWVAVALLVAGLLATAGYLAVRPDPDAVSSSDSSAADTTGDGSIDTTGRSLDTAPATEVPTTAIEGAGSPVGFSATGTCQAPDGVDGFNSPVAYDPSFVGDGRPDTAWRCSGDATGQSLTLTFAQPIRVDRVGLVAGYPKLDPKTGEDRFPQQRRISSARWECAGAGGSVVDQATQDLADVREVQETTVDFTACSAVRMVILGTRPPGSTRDFTPVAEVRVIGCCPGVGDG
jgi:hypothetical protein